MAGTSRVMFAVMVISLLVCSSARAQDAKRSGITMGYPAAVGFLLPVSDRVAFRPDVTYSGSKFTGPSPAGTTSWNIGFGLTALLYLRKYDHLRTYVAPRVDYGYSRTSSDTGLTSAATSLSRWGAGATGYFGAQYDFSERFSVFGEAGFGFSHSTLPSSTGGPSGSANSWGTRAGVGVVFYP